MEEFDRAIQQRKSSYDHRRYTPPRSRPNGNSRRNAPDERLHAWVFYQWQPQIHLLPGMVKSGKLFLINFKFVTN